MCKRMPQTCGQKIDFVLLSDLIYYPASFVQTYQ